MTGILIVLAVVAVVFVLTYFLSDRAKISNRLAWYGGLASSALAGMDFTSLAPYVGSDWRMLIAMAAIMFAISLARQIPERS